MGGQTLHGLSTLSHNLAIKQNDSSLWSPPPHGRFLPSFPSIWVSFLSHFILISSSFQPQLTIPTLVTRNQGLTLAYSLAQPYHSRLNHCLKSSSVRLNHRLSQVKPIRLLIFFLVRFSNFFRLRFCDTLGQSKNRLSIFENPILLSVPISRTNVISLFEKSGKKMKKCISCEQCFYVFFSDFFYQRFHFFLN